MIVRILFWLLVLAAVYCGLGSLVVPRNQSDANETFQSVAEELGAGSGRQVAHNCFGLLPDLVGKQPARPFPGLARLHPLVQLLG